MLLRVESIAEEREAVILETLKENGHMFNLNLDFIANLLVIN